MAEEQGKPTEDNNPCAWTLTNVQGNEQPLQAACQKALEELGGDNEAKQAFAAMLGKVYQQVIKTLQDSQWSDDDDIITLLVGADFATENGQQQKIGGYTLAAVALGKEKAWQNNKGTPNVTAIATLLAQGYTKAAVALKSAGWDVKDIKTLLVGEDSSSSQPVGYTLAAVRLGEKPAWQNNNTPNVTAIATLLVKGYTQAAVTLKNAGWKTEDIKTLLAGNDGNSQPAGYTLAAVRLGEKPAWQNNNTPNVTAIATLLVKGYTPAAVTLGKKWKKQEETSPADPVGETNQEAEEEIDAPAIATLLAGDYTQAAVALGKKKYAWDASGKQWNKTKPVWEPRSIAEFIAGHAERFAESSTPNNGVHLPDQHLAAATALKRAEMSEKDIGKFIMALKSQQNNCNGCNVFEKIKPENKKKQDIIQKYKVIGKDIAHLLCLAARGNFQCDKCQDLFYTIWQRKEKQWETTDLMTLLVRYVTKAVAALLLMGESCENIQEIMGLKTEKTDGGGQA